MATDVADPPGGAVQTKGLKAGVLGSASPTVVGVASTLAACSLGATLGFVAAASGIAHLGAPITAEAVKVAHDTDASAAVPVDLVNDRPADSAHHRRRVCSDRSPRWCTDRLAQSW